MQHLPLGLSLVPDSPNPQSTELMSNATSALLASYGASAFPVGPEALFMPDDKLTVFNASAATPAFLETVAEIKDLSPNARHATQATNAKRAKYLRHDGEDYLFLHKHTSGNTNTRIEYFSAMNIPGNLEIVVNVAMIDWTTATNEVIAARFASVGSLFGWLIYTEIATGKMIFQFYQGLSQSVATSTVAVGLADNAQTWMSVQFKPNFSGGNSQVKFFLSPDRVTWTQLGATINIAYTANIGSVAANLELGGYDNGGVLSGGNLRLFQLELWSGEKDTGTKVVHWRASDSTHLANTGPLFVGSTTAIYAGNAHLIKRGVLFADAAAVEYDLASSISPVLNVSQCMECRTATFSGGTLKIFSFGNTADYAPFGAFVYTTSSYVGNLTSRYFTATSTGVLRISGNVNGASGSININGVNSSGASSSHGGTGIVINRILARKNDDFTQGIVGRFALWQTGTLPSLAQMDSFMAP